jgi:hypothetical protein
LFCAGSLPDCHFVDAKYAPSVESLVAASPIEKSVELSALIQRPAPPFIAGAEGKKWRVSHRTTPSALLCRGLMMFAFCDNLKVRGLFLIPSVLRAPLRPTGCRKQYGAKLPDDLETTPNSEKPARGMK